MTFKHATSDQPEWNHVEYNAKLLTWFSRKQIL